MGSLVPSRIGNPTEHKQDWLFLEAPKDHGEPHCVVFPWNHWLGTKSNGEYAGALGANIALKPQSPEYVHSASAGVIPVPALKMLFDAQAGADDTLMIGEVTKNVGAYAAQIASEHRNARDR